MCEIQVSRNEASSPNADHYMRKGKTPMNDPGEEQLMESEMQNLKLHDSLGSEAAPNIIDISDKVIPENIISYSTMTFKVSAFCSVCYAFSLFCQTIIYCEA
jgi:hypothetical protein